VWVGLSNDQPPEHRHHRPVDNQPAPDRGRCRGRSFSGLVVGEEVEVNVLDLFSGIGGFLNIGLMHYETTTSCVKNFKNHNI